jgi:hypothetical protein
MARSCAARWVQSSPSQDRLLVATPAPQHCLNGAGEITGVPQWKRAPGAVALHPGRELVPSKEQGKYMSYFEDVELAKAHFDAT